MGKSTYGRKAVKMRVATSMRRMRNYTPKRIFANITVRFSNGKTMEFQKKEFEF